MSIRRIKDYLKRSATKFHSIGCPKFQIDIWANDDGTYTFLKKYFSNGATILLAERLISSDAFLLYKEFEQMEA